MSLAPGGRLGPYEVAGEIGAGGMGVVYRATDTRLGREVAIKVLPDAFANDADRLARFEREAHVLASLNHPNIAHIHGIEQAGNTTALVMELVDGPTLDELIRTSGRQSQGLPVSDAIAIARQITGALEAAHDQGIVHRDLKPANVKVTGDDHVKVLDFGLARVTDPRQRVANLADSPTVTSPAMTEAGAILGTAAYMSPEQAKGRTADKRSDIWSFGCVLYEMLTGVKAFAGESVSETLANVLKTDPDWTRLPSGLPAGIRRCLEGCLKRDRQERLRDFSTVSFLLTEPASLWTAPPSANARAARPRWLPWAVALGAAACVGVATWFIRPAQPATNLTTRFQHFLPDGEVFSIGGRAADISPDGTAIVYSADRGIYLKRLDELGARLITGTENEEARFPAFAPDSRSIAYGTRTGEIRRISIEGGTPLTLSRLPEVIQELTWQRDTVVASVTVGAESGILAIPQSGGERRRIVTTDPRVESAFDVQIVDDTHVLFTLRTLEIPAAVGGNSLVVEGIGGGPRRVLVRGATSGRILPSGHLAYVGGDGAIRVVPFDRQRLEVVGDPVVVQAGVSPAFRVSSDGTLVYQTPAPPPRRAMVWVDRQGRETQAPLAPSAFYGVRISPDGTQIVLTDAGDIWIWTIAQEVLTNLTSTVGSVEYNPLWTPDGQGVLFDTSDGTARRILRKAANGIGNAVEVASAPAGYPNAITPDGAFIAYHTQANIGWVRPLAPAGPARPLRSENVQAFNASFSPDGNWVAYQSNESGRSEIYVHPFPAMEAGRRQVSTGGGAHPLWAPRGNELFYIDGAGRMTAVPVDTRGDSTFSRGVALFPAGQYFVNVARNYDVTADAQRFVFTRVVNEAERPRSITIVRHWLDEVERLVREE